MRIQILTLLGLLMLGCSGTDTPPPGGEAGRQVTDPARGSANVAVAEHPQEPYFGNRNNFV